MDGNGCDGWIPKERDTQIRLAAIHADDYRNVGKEVMFGPEPRWDSI